MNGLSQILKEWHEVMLLYAVIECATLKKILNASSKLLDTVYGLENSRCIAV